MRLIRLVLAISVFCLFVSCTPTLTDTAGPMAPMYWKPGAVAGTIEPVGGKTLSAPAYGVRWDSDADTYEQGIVVDGYFVVATLADFPVQEQMQRVVLEDDGTVGYYLCATDSTDKADCSTASDLTGTDGQVMVQIPAFYYIQHHYSDYRYFLIASGPFQLILPDGSTAGSAVHPAFTKEGSHVDYRYIGAYEGAMYDDSASAMTVPGSVHTNLYASGDKLCSVSGNYPKTNETRDEFRSMAEERGTGWHQFSAYDQSMVSILYLTEHGDFNSQSEIGNGRVNLSGGTWIAGEAGAGGYIGISGLSDGDGNASGNTSVGGAITGSQSSDYMSYRGIENWWGNVWKHLDGVNVHNSAANGSRLYLCGNYTDFADDTSTGYSLVGTLAESDDYSTDIIDAVGVWSSAVGGSSSTYLTDYYYTYYDEGSDSGWRIVRMGGVSVDGTIAGAFCAYSRHQSSAVANNVGARLCY